MLRSTESSSKRIPAMGRCTSTLAVSAPPVPDATTPTTPSATPNTRPSCVTVAMLGSSLRHVTTDVCVVKVSCAVWPAPSSMTFSVNAIRCATSDGAADESQPARAAIVRTAHARRKVGRCFTIFWGGDSGGCVASEDPLRGDRTRRLRRDHQRVNAVMRRAPTKKQSTDARAVRCVTTSRNDCFWSP